MENLFLSGHAATHRVSGSKHTMIQPVQEASAEEVHIEIPDDSSGHRMEDLKHHTAGKPTTFASFNKVVRLTTLNYGVNVQESLLAKYVFHLNVLILLLKYQGVNCQKEYERLEVEKTPSGDK